MKSVKDLAKSVLYMFQTMGLYTARKVGDVWIVERTQITEEKAKKLNDIFNQLDEYGYYAPQDY